MAMSNSSPAVSAPVAPVVSPEVCEYARKHGIEPTVQQLIDVTPRLYPTARSIRVFMEQDAEIEELWFLVFEVEVPKVDVPDCLAAEKRWLDEKRKAYPYPRNHAIILHLIRID
jgi:hypothetical protein